TTYAFYKVARAVTITASSPGLPSARFTETGTPAAPKWLLIVSGNYQTALVNTKLPSPLVTKIADQYGNGVPGLNVSFSDGAAGGIPTPTSVTTDSLSHARVSYATPANAGTITITASSPGLVSKNFSETATTSATTALTATSEDELCTVFELLGRNCLGISTCP